MIVCQCEAVCEKRLREAIAAGASTVEEVGRACGAGTGCGACREQIGVVLQNRGGDSGPLSLVELIRGKAA
jgi:bacterioferritin-associated ferredoxin